MAKPVEVTPRMEGGGAERLLPRSGLNESRPGIFHSVLLNWAEAPIRNDASHTKTAGLSSSDPCQPSVLWSVRGVNKRKEEREDTPALG